MKPTFLHIARTAVARLVLVALGSRIGYCQMLACGLFLFSGTIWAQPDKSPISLPSPTERSNPASFTDARLTISTAEVAAQFYSNGSTFGSVLSLFSLAHTSEQSTGQSSHRIFSEQSLQTLGIHYRADAKTQLTLAHRIRGFQQWHFGEQLVQLLQSGRLDRSQAATDVGAYLDAFAYQDYSFGIAIQAAPKLRLGLRMHYLTGGAALLTERARIAVAPTEDGRYFRVGADAVWHTSGLGASLGAPHLESGWLNNANRGYSLDFGAIYMPRPNLSIGLEFSGIGHIRWHAGAYTHRSAGRYLVRGIPYRTGGDSSNSIPLSMALHQLHEELEVASTPTSLRAALPSTTRLSVRYALADRYTLSGTLQHLRYRDAGYSELSATLHRRIKTCWQLGLTIRSVEFDQLQIGVASEWQLGPVRGFIGIINAPALSQPLRTRAATARFGLALAFGELPTD